MDIFTIIAFVLGVVIVGAFFLIKNYKLINLDKTASQVIGILNKALVNYSDVIKAYDAENKTDYYESLSKMMKKISDMEADTEITPLEFALNVVEMYEDISAILKNANLYDKVVTVEIKL